MVLVQNLPEILDSAFASSLPGSGRNAGSVLQPSRDALDAGIPHGRHAVYNLCLFSLPFACSLCMTGPQALTGNAQQEVDG